MDSAEFHASVYNVVRQIPFGKVTSYGHVAKLIGLPRHSRHVGQALKYLPPDTDVPWQRVVSASGKISSRGPGTEGAARQREALIEEGVNVFESGGAGIGGQEWRIRWAECGWFPESVELNANPPEREDPNDHDRNGEQGSVDGSDGAGEDEEANPPR